MRIKTTIANGRPDRDKKNKSPDNSVLHFTDVHRPWSDP